MATVGYQAAPETNQTQISYASEVTWGTLPAVAFQAIRYTGETLSGSKTRTRPGEIISTGESAAAITTQETAGGAVNFALSYGTFDAFFAGMLNSTWQAPQVISGVGGDISISLAGGVFLTSTTANKFANIQAGQWIRLFGFTNAANNTFVRVMVKNSSTNLTIVSSSGLALVNETPAGTAAQVRASTIINGTTFQSFYLQQQLSSSTFLVYPGAYISGFTLSGGTGSFLSGSFTFMAQQEMSAVVNQSTGSVLPAPTGRVHDPVAGFGGVLLNETPVNAVVDSFQIQGSYTGAAQEYGMGVAAAQGQIMGLLEVKGTLKLYFKDFTLYSRFKSETLGTLEFITKDPAGNAYIITILNCALMNPNIDTSGPNKAVMATFNIEGNPQAAGGTIQIDRLPSV